MVVSPLFWEWFNVWLAQFLKNLYHELKMVAIRGGNSTLGNVPRGCGFVSRQPTIEVSQNLSMPHAVPPNVSHRHHQNHAGHMPNLMNHSNHMSHVNQPVHANHHEHHNQKSVNVNHGNFHSGYGQGSGHSVNGHTSAGFSHANMQPMHHHNQMGGHKMQYVQKSPRHSNASRPSQYRPYSYPRASTPHMPIPGAGAECYHPAGGAGPAYMPSGSTGAPIQGMRAQSTPQPSAPPQPEMPKNNMGAHNYVSPPNATQSARPQYPNFQYRAAQHTTRPASHARQQQPYIPAAGATAGGPVMYHPTLLFQTAHMQIPQSYQPRSTTPGFYPYMPYVYTNTNPGHSSPLTYPPDFYNGQAVAANGARTTQGPLVPQPAAQHQPQPQPHMTISGVRQGPAKRMSHRVRIVDPVTQLDVVLEDIFANDSQYISAESSERQTPQADNSASIVEEFTRLVSEAANQATSCETGKTNYVPKCNEVPAATAGASQPQANAINSNNNNEIVKSEIIDSKQIGTDAETDPPIVSAISDSPVIVPKLTSNKLQKGVESPIVDKNPKAKKPHVPQNETDKQSELSQAETVATLPPQPQRIREPRERAKPHEDKEKPAQEEPKPNGPETALISSIESQPEIETHSQISEIDIAVKETVFKEATIETEPQVSVETEPVVNSETTFPDKQAPTATQLLSSIEKVAKEQEATIPDLTEEEKSASQAQAKLTQSIVSAARNNPDSKMKDINLNNTMQDSDTDNGNVSKVDNVKEDMNKNEKSMKNVKNKKNKNASTELPKSVESNAMETYENGKDETDRTCASDSKEIDSEQPLTPKEEAAPVFVPKHKYSDDQWSPLNRSGEKKYDIRLLMQIKDDPMSRNKPNAPLLETCNILRTAPMQDPMLVFNQIQRPLNDAVFPNFLKNSSSGNMRAPIMRDNKKDGRSVGNPTGKGSMKLNSPSSGSGGRNIFISLREEVKLNETKDAWKPARLKKETLDEQELKTQELYKKFRGILNKLTPQKFDTLIDKVKTLEIDTQERLDGVIDLVFQKAIDEPNFSEAYAAMCNKLSTHRVPVANSHDNACVNFRAMIISKCQSQFVKEETDENVIKIRAEIAECNDQAKKKELHLQLEEQQRRVRMRSVGNVRFIGELYKLKMLTAKIMVFCMTHLIEKLEEEKLECLCKLLTTIGEQVESEVREQLEAIFKRMQDIVNDRKNKISSRVRFMIQDVIELRRRKWVAKNVIDSQPKMMDQIQKEAEQHQRHIELMNSSMGGGGGGGFRREEGGGRKRGGEGRRQGGGGNFVDNTWKTTSTRSSYVVDTTKLKGVTPQKNLSSIKLAPHQSAWNQGSGTKVTQQAIPPMTNPFGMLENVQADPTSLRNSKDLAPAAYTHSKSIERSTFSSRPDFHSGGRSGSTVAARSNSGTRSPSVTPAEPIAPRPKTPAANVQQEPLPADKQKLVKQIVELCLMNPNDDEMVEEIKLFSPQHHAAIITEILNIALEKNAKEIGLLVKSAMHVVNSGAISPDNFMAGVSEILECAADLYIDIPMLYEYLGKFIAPHIEKKNVTLEQVYKSSKSVISVNHGHLLLRAVLKDLKDSMGPTFTKSKWHESGLKFSQWMNADMVSKWLSDNHFEFLDGSVNIHEDDTKRIMTPNETQNKLLQLMNSDESCDCLRGWVKDNIGASTSEEWFLRCLTQAICEHALFGPERSPAAHFNHDRMNKYSPLIGDYAESQAPREASCLFGIQQLIHRLEHPQGLTLEIFQYLHEQYIISVEGFIAWETSEKEPEGKAVMLKALTSFFTNIREADNEDSCSEA
ncbi:unnamed protein product [Leptosia nina]|uniref:Eukaryotic translation initiation factor 4G n=1 Tax=Leptosia nina TaxID=320188 RepID=A0AAV1JZM9_9NEOP